MYENFQAAVKSNADDVALRVERDGAWQQWYGKKGRKNLNRKLLKKKKKKKKKKTYFYFHLILSIKKAFLFNLKFLLYSKMIFSAPE